MSYNIGVIDAEFIDPNIKNSFPNLACMKISGYHKRIGDNVSLIEDVSLFSFGELKKYDKIFISKVFTSTNIHSSLLKLPNVSWGGQVFL
jgi:hypothetical protein